MNRAIQAKRNSCLRFLRGEHDLRLRAVQFQVQMRQLRGKRRCWQLRALDNEGTLTMYKLRRVESESVTVSYRLFIGHSRNKTFSHGAIKVTFLQNDFHIAE